MTIIASAVIKAIGLPERSATFEANLRKKPDDLVIHCSILAVTRPTGLCRDPHVVNLEEPVTVLKVHRWDRRRERVWPQAKTAPTSNNAALTGLNPLLAAVTGARTSSTPPTEPGEAIRWNPTPDCQPVQRPRQCGDARD